MSYIINEIRTSEGRRINVIRELPSLYDLTLFAIRRDLTDDELKIYVIGFTTPGYPAIRDGQPHLQGLTCDSISAKQLNDYIYNVALVKHHDDVGLPRLLGSRLDPSMRLRDNLFTDLEDDNAEHHIFHYGIGRTAYIPMLTDIFTEMKAIEERDNLEYLRYITPSLQRREHMVCETF